MVSKVSRYIQNNFFVRFVKHPRFKAGASALFQVIISCGILLKKETVRDKLQFAFRNIKKIPTPSRQKTQGVGPDQPTDKEKTQNGNDNTRHDSNNNAVAGNASQPAEPAVSKQVKADIEGSSKGATEIAEDQHSAESTANDATVKASLPPIPVPGVPEGYCEIAREIMAVEKEYPESAFNEAVVKASNLALQLLDYSDRLPCYNEMKDAIAKKNNGKDFQVLMQEEIFKRAFGSFMEAKAKVVPTKDWDVIEVGPQTKSLFGEVAYLMGEDLGTSAKVKTAVIVPFAFLDEGSCNEINLAAAPLRGKICVTRQFKESDTVKPPKDLNKMHIELQKIDALRKKIIKMHYSTEEGSILSWAKGGKLRTWLEGNRSNSDKQRVVREICEFIRQLHEGPEPDHQKKYVLSDLKSENILFKDAEFQKLRFTDLDGAFMQGTPSTGVTTPSYAAPELFCQAPETSEFTDRWALGMLLYEIKNYTAKGDYDSPVFVDDALEHLYNKTLTVDEIRDNFEIDLKTPEKYFDLNDPYDQIIVDLIKYNPLERISLATVCDRLKYVPLESYTIKREPLPATV